MNMLATITPKSDQINADDLIGGPMTIRVRDVKIEPGVEQPVSVFFEGDGGKPYKVCKSMRRVLVNVWGPDASAYVGRSMTLYRDPEVQFGGMKVGGIRISHMSHITKPVTMALTATRANRRPFTVQPLKEDAARQEEAQPQKPSPEEMLARAKAKVAALLQQLETADAAAVNAILEDKATAGLRNWLPANAPDMNDELEAAIEAACARTAGEEAA